MLGLFGFKKHWSIRLQNQRSFRERSINQQIDRQSLIIFLDQSKRLSVRISNTDCLIDGSKWIFYEAIYNQWLSNDEMERIVLILNDVV